MMRWSMGSRVGCVLPTRDPIDQRIMQEVQNRTGSIIDVQGGYPHGTPYSTSQVAWQVLNCNTAAPTDTDHDGMPDAYETANGLNPNDPADRAALAANGYANLENYLNGLVARTLLGTQRAVSSSELLAVYPNPTQAGQVLTVQHPLQAGQAGAFTLYSFDGRRVATAAASPGSSSTALDISRLSAGNYLLLYEAAPGAQRLSVKFIKTE
ncbi:MAG: T9SS type A sorting domain-containing protein [Hymenobacter sp.]|nr:MAG: T9SS type A sorting domain-containing protein [Hymenobacter sp.]